MRIERFTIEEADLTVRSYRCLKRYGIAYMDELCNMTNEELSKIRNLGSKSIAEIKEKMNEFGLSLKD
jgi:DNA-directed RNA polymerase subunit alpha